MIPEIGHFALILALSLCGAQMFFAAVGHYTGSALSVALARNSALLSFLLTALAFLILVNAYRISDFSVQNVWENSHTDKPLLFKITGTWGNHEGSMLLWVLILTFFTALVASYGRNLPRQLYANVLAVQGAIGFAFMLFVEFTSNPFSRLFPTPIEGQDLNPLLQDIGLAIHPPLLYLGYVGLSVAFSFAIGALITGKIDAAWARWVRPWTLVAWIFLTLGISMGSYWAYYELGWGGWWFWDPVENASFMPWLAATALLHSAIVMEKRGALKVWTILLAIIAFSLSLLGTFLVRSGVLTSVHAFATDPTRGTFILIILLIFVGGGFGLFALRAAQLKQGGIFAPISREGALILNNVFLSTATATILIGTLYPLAVEAISGTKISVGPPYFNLTFVSLMIPLLLCVPFGPFLAWKRGDLKGVLQRLQWAALFSLLVSLGIFAIAGDYPFGASVGVLLGLWLVLGSLSELAFRVKLFKAPLSTSWQRFKGLPRSAFGTAFAHAGLGLTVLGIVGVSAFETENAARMQAGDVLQLGEVNITLEEIVSNQGPNYIERIVILNARKAGRSIAIMKPAKRIYPARDFPTTEAAIVSQGLTQLYATLGNFEDSNTIVVRVSKKPIILLIWIGTLFMAFGGFVSLLDRRLRIGLPQRAKASGLEA